MTPADYEYYEGLDRLMGTQIRLHAFHAAGREAWMRELADRFFDRLAADDRRLSLYAKDSLVSRINGAAGGEPVPLDGDTFALLAACSRWWKLTGGLFDITAGALMKAYGFLPGSRPDREEAAYTDRLTGLIGCGLLELDPTGRTARLPRPGMLIDLGGVAKGWCVEKASSILQSAGLDDFVVSAGTSTILARGAPAGETAWPMELEGLAGDPQGAHNFRLTDCSVSVSGNYRNTRAGAEGAVLRHIMDPRTLRPVEEVRQVVVVGPDAAECEAFSTAFLIQGSSEGAFSLRDRPDVAVSFQSLPVPETGKPLSGL